MLYYNDIYKITFWDIFLAVNCTHNVAESCG